MQKAKQISVVLENKLDNLAYLHQCLKSKDISVMGVSVVEYTMHTVVRMIVDKPAAVVEVLGGQGFLSYDQTDVLLVDMPMGINGLAELAGKLDPGKVSVEFTYSCKSPDGQKSYMVVGASDIEAVMRVLEEKE